MTTETLDQARERLRPCVERARGFTGWMAPVHSRPLGAGHPWDYMARARQLIAPAASMLDIGTGGGERFGDLLQGYDGRAIATEEWPLNAPVAATHLRQFGAETVHCQSTTLPFADASFDLMLNRHEEMTPADVARGLRPGGSVLTQQVFMHWIELQAFFPRRVLLTDLFDRYRDGFRDAGLDIIDARTSQVPVVYDSLGDFVYMLCICPWEVPDFDPLGADLGALLDLERALTTPDGLVLTDGSFIIEARKRAS